ncbi:MAG: DNA-binding protein [Deltaproteobacteria bacterium]|nr:DNA-binding protein [Deltaproteobacteria bacterium]
MVRKPTNEEIADVLDRVASLLEAQHANPYRVRAYRRAARIVEQHERSIAELAASEEGTKLENLPEIGKSIAGAIREFSNTWRLGLLERLEGQVSPEDLFTTVPGIGEELAHRIHATLNIETLEGLELAAHDGRLEQVPGLGERRVRNVRDVLAATLSRSSRRRARRLSFLKKEIHGHDETTGPICPSVETILDVDEEYRRKAAVGALKTITPRRFNPESESWLPILHTEREGWHFTALFSNTARAHELGRTRDWVVVYYECDGHENQHTVVTERRGPFRGRRVIRGLERPCMTYYSEKEKNRSPSAKRSETDQGT